MDTVKAQFSDIVVLINYSRNNAIRHVNAELINLYWNVGAYISKKIASAAWGEKTVEDLSEFIQLNYPEIKGFNKRGLYRMRKFYETYIELAVVTPLVSQLECEEFDTPELQPIINKEDTIMSTVLTQLKNGNQNKKSKTKSTKKTSHSIENKEDTIVSTVLTQLDISDIRESVLAKIGWSQHLLLLSRCKSNLEREFYLKLCIKEKYTVRELDRQISASCYERSMLSDTKIAKVLKDVVPDISRHFKDKYVFEFLNLPEPYNESDFQKGLIKKMKSFLLEIGKDFLFVDEEYRLQVGNRDFKADLLFYHRELRCLVAFELKTTAFEPEYLGKLNFYLEALDRDVKKPHENPSIGILLCKDNDSEVVEYAMNRSLSPALISQYTLALPDKKVLQAKLRELFDMWNDQLREE